MPANGGVIVGHRKSEQLEDARGRDRATRYVSGIPSAAILTPARWDDRAGLAVGAVGLHGEEGMIERANGWKRRVRGASPQAVGESADTGRARSLGYG
jgi:hypothetical protein